MKNRKTKLLCLIMTVIMVISLLPATVLATDPESIQIGIYSTTDMHGKVYDQNPVGGTWKDSYLKVATVMKQERSEMDGTILIDNGGLMLLIRLGCHDLVAKCIVNVVIIALNYIFSKLFIFKKRV